MCCSFIYRMNTLCWLHIYVFSFCFCVLCYYIYLSCIKASIKSNCVHEYILCIFIYSVSCSVWKWYKIDLYIYIYICNMYDIVWRRSSRIYLCCVCFSLRLFYAFVFRNVHEAINLHKIYIDPDMFQIHGPIHRIFILFMYHHTTYLRYLPYLPVGLIFWQINIYIFLFIKTFRCNALG